MNECLQVERECRWIDAIQPVNEIHPRANPTFLIRDLRRVSGVPCFVVFLSDSWS